MSSLWCETVMFPPVLSFSLRPRRVTLLYNYFFLKLLLISYYLAPQHGQLCLTKNGCSSHTIFQTGAKLIQKQIIKQMYLI